MGMGKGMDGHAGKDLVVKVPCGTLVWRLAPEGTPEEAGEVSRANARLTARQLQPASLDSRWRTGGRAVEVDLSRAGDAMQRLRRA